jgi:hypothetical protein
MDTKSAPRRKARRPLEQEQLKRLVLPYLEQLDTPRSLSVWLLFSQGEHAQLLDLAIDPLRYNDAESFRKDYCATELLKKSDLLDTGINTTEVAVKVARDAESLCRSTNERFEKVLNETPSSGLDETMLCILHNARKKLLKIIGDSPPKDLLTHVGWSPGRTTVSYGPALSALEKYRVKPDVTLAAHALGIQLLNSSPRWAQSAIDADGACSLIPVLGVLKIAEGNVGLVVPKNAKTGRFICYEPHLNIALQRPIGSWLRRRLKNRCNVDLDDQTINGEMAVRASREGNLATLDLSSASDTLSKKLVQFLLPEEWYHLMDRVRSRQTKWPGKSEYEVNAKFSSMGNGFTFELESLVFYTLVWAAYKFEDIRMIVSRDGNTHVYGDDIIVDSRVYETVVKTLSFAGFQVNTKKSYNTGFFRESCGTNAFAGQVINPPRIRPGQRGLSMVIAFHNRIREHWANYFGFLPRSIAQLTASFRRDFPGPLGPCDFGDGHYHVNLDEACPFRANHAKRYSGWEGWFFRTRKPFQKSRLHSFLDGSGGYHFRKSFEIACYLAATGPRKPYELEKTLLEAGSFTKSTLRVYTMKWCELLVLD